MTELTSEKIDNLIELCISMLNQSYCPYSRFAVGAVLVTDCGKIFTGCNVESASYGLAICAERTAAVKAISEGFRKFKACFVTTRSPSKVLPCGACRQFLAEYDFAQSKFGLDLQLYLIGSDRNYEIKTLREILPNAFTPAELESGVV